MRTRISAALALVLALTLTGCGLGISSSSESQQAPEPVAPVETQEPVAPPEPEPEDIEVGNRENPFPFGEVVYIENLTTGDPVWDIRVDPWSDATAAVLGENQFNEAPAAGNIYLSIPVNIVWRGAEPIQPWLDWENGIEVAYVGADGITYEEEFVVQPWPSIADIADMYQGAAADFVTVVQVPATVDGLVRVTAGGFDFFVGPAA